LATLVHMARSVAALGTLEAEMARTPLFEGCLPQVISSLAARGTLRP
jgi:hypothetical protein